MMKFFRKYMKQILAVSMGLLLVIWLVGDALTSMYDPQQSQQDIPRGEVYGRPVTLTDMQPAFEEARVLSALGVEWTTLWQYPVREISPNEYAFYAAVRQVRDPQKQRLTEDEWYMLDAEAQHHQIFVRDEDVEGIAKRIDPAFLSSIQRFQNLSRQQIHQAIRAFVRVLEGIRTAGEGIKVSEADIQDFVRQTQEKASVRLAMIDGSKLIDPTYEPSEQELKDLFEKGKDRDPVPDSFTEFGYRRPERVQIEYVQVSAKVLADRQRIGEEEAFDYWTEHKEEFLRPSTRPETAPASRPQAEVRQPYDTFTEAKPFVIEKLMEAGGRSESLRLARDMIGRLSRPWAAAPATQPGGYRQPPESETRENIYPDLIKAMEGRHPGVFKYARTTLVDAAALALNAEIGRASAFAETPRPVSFLPVAFMVAGLEADREANPDHARLFRNVYETCAEPVVDRAGNAYVFRNVAALPRQAPASWQEVRDQLVADVRKTRAHAEAGGRARALAGQAAQVGLQKAFEADTELKAKLGDAALQTPGPFSRSIMWQMDVIPGAVPGAGDDEALMALCFDLASKSVQADRVKAHELQGGRGWVVVEGVAVTPVTQPVYEEQRRLAMLLLTSKWHVAFLKNWFDPDQIRRRVGWKEREAPAPKEDAGTAQDQAPGRPAAAPEATPPASPPATPVATAPAAS